MITCDSDHTPIYLDVKFSFFFLISVKKKKGKEQTKKQIRVLMKLTFVYKYILENL